MADSPASRLMGPVALLRAIALALGLGLGLAMLAAPAASANEAQPSFSCSGVTFSFIHFPAAAGNTIKEIVYVDGNVIAHPIFSFDGPSGSNVISFLLPPGHHSMDARAMWDTNGVRGGRDTPLVGGIKCAAEPDLKVEKLQQIAGGSGSYTGAPLLATAGHTVEYRLLARNTGNVMLTFAPVDTGCDAGTFAAAPGGTWVLAGETRSYTCKHTLTSADQAAGRYENTASVTGTPSEGEGSPLTRASNTVLVTVPAPPRPAFTIEKQQMIFGSGESFSASPLRGEVGQTVDYRITVEDTGNTSLSLVTFADPNCEGIAGGAVGGSLAPGGSATYTCEHLLTTADQAAGGHENSATVLADPPAGEGLPVSHTSNTVLVRVPEPARPAFTVEKQQAVAGGGQAPTSGPLAAALGQTLDYRIVVTNTGNTTLSVATFIDTNCQGIAGGPGAKALAPREASVYTCQRLLSGVGSYENSATVVVDPPEGAGPPITRTSNTVLASVAPQPAFSIEKQQSLEGSRPFTASPLRAKVGETVDYRITVKNTGNTTLGFVNFIDATCEGIAGGPSAPLSPGESAAYSCHHVLRGPGPYENNATVTALPPAGQGAAITHTSNTVVVTATEAPKPSLSIGQLHRLAGHHSEYTTEPLATEVGETMEYEILVTNTGNVPLALSDLRDAHCEGVAISGGPGEKALAPSETTAFTCSHVMSAQDVLSAFNGDSATVTGTPPEGDGAALLITSNLVAVRLPEPPAQPTAGVAAASVVHAPNPALAAASPDSYRANLAALHAGAAPALHGPEGCVRGLLRASLAASGVRSVTFYLDGSKLGKLAAKDVRGGRFSVAVAVAPLALGAHRLVARIALLAASSTGVVPAARSLTFLRCASASVTPKFTG